MSMLFIEYATNKVKRMLGQRLETNLKSQTLPRLDGQDEEAEPLDGQFEILSIANSCPDLSVLEEEGETGDRSHCALNGPLLVTNGQAGDTVDGVFKKAVCISKIGSAVRRSTSLSSLGNENGGGSQTCLSNGRKPKELLDSCRPKVAAPGELERKFVKVETSAGPLNAVSGVTEFVRSGLRASHGGLPGHLQKSISSPSVSHYFLGAAGVVSSGNDSVGKGVASAEVHHTQSTKRSFFRRKHKSKGGGQLSKGRMEVTADRLHAPSLHCDMFQSLGFAALQDPGLGLQDADAELWQLSISSDVGGRLDEREKKRQEAMYEVVITEKHHCLNLALMQHLFVGDMKRAGFGAHARRFFPEINKLLEVHCKFLRKLRERQMKFRDLNEPVDTIADILAEFTSNPALVRLHGLVCASHNKSLEMFEVLKKDQKFASLIAAWDKEPLLSRKNVKECLLFVVQRITKYPMLIEKILKNSTLSSEKDLLEEALKYSKKLNVDVNQRVAERENLIKLCSRINEKSYTTIGSSRIGRDHIMNSKPSRRCLFDGLADCTRTISNNALSSKNTVLVLTDYLVFIQELSGRYNFVSPHGIVLLKNVMIRENASDNSSFYLVLGTGTKNPEMIEVKVLSPLDRKLWMDKIRDAMKCVAEESEGGSDGDDDSVDAVDLSDLRTTKALEELQEQDKQLLTILRSRSKIVENLRSEKPHHWAPSNFDGRDTLLSSLSNACHEVQRVLGLWETNPAYSVNRSSSCVSEHLGQHEALMGLPKRADTFGGFDCQQRTSLEISQSNNNKVLMEIVLCLNKLCGDMFSQMIPQLMPSIYQNHQQLQRRMEELREAQQRLESEKAQWQQEMSSQKGILEKERNEMSSLKQALQKEQDDINQQRENLYRKLEKLQTQGIRPPLDPISPLSNTTTVEKSGQNSVGSRRPGIPSSQSTGSLAPQNPQSVNGVKSKQHQQQQLPMFLANHSKNKTGSSENHSSINRGSLMSSFKSSSGVPNNHSANVPSSENPQKSFQQTAKLSGSGKMASVQQLLPLRLSEGSAASKTASLPRGMGSRSASNIMAQEQLSSPPNGNASFKGTTNNCNLAGVSAAELPNQLGMPSNSSFLYGPAAGFAPEQGGTRTTTRYAYNRNSITNENLLNSGGAVDTISVHRRSGSSPVPMSSVPQRRTVSSEIHYHQHPFMRTKEDDSEGTILYL